MGLRLYTTNGEASLLRNSFPILFPFRVRFIKQLPEPHQHSLSSITFRTRAPGFSHSILTPFLTFLTFLFLKHVIHSCANQFSL